MSPELAAELRDGLAQRGCPVCRVLRSREDGYWDGLLYAGFQDAGVLASFAAIGLCPRHLDQLDDSNDAFAAAQLALATLTGAERAPAGRPQGLPMPGASCPACVALAVVERRALETLAALLDRDPRARALYGRSDGICLDHLRRAEEVEVPAVAIFRRHLRRVLQSHRDAVEALPAGHADPRGRRRALAAIHDEPGSVL